MRPRFTFIHPRAALAALLIAAAWAHATPPARVTTLPDGRKVHELPRVVINFKRLPAPAAAPATVPRPPEQDGREPRFATRSPGRPNTDPAPSQGRSDAAPEQGAQYARPGVSRPPATNGGRRLESTGGAAPAGLSLPVAQFFG